MRIASLLAPLILLLLILACKKEYRHGEISQAAKDNLSSHCFSTENMQPADGGYIVENDIFISEADLNQPIQTEVLRLGQTEQFQTYNLVRGLPRVITLSYAGDLPSIYLPALDEAIRRFNDLNLQLHFQRISGHADIDVVKGIGTFLAVSGFPGTDGNPYGTIKINPVFVGSGAGTPFVNYVATIITHEIGHCIGFRHTDFLNRSFSCGGKKEKETCGSAGAILIPGTVADPGYGSWMLTCITKGEDRPFTPNDIIALNYLY